MKRLLLCLTMLTSTYSYSQCESHLHSHETLADHSKDVSNGYFIGVGLATFAFPIAGLIVMAVSGLASAALNSGSESDKAAYEQCMRDYHSPAAVHRRNMDEVERAEKRLRDMKI